MYSPLLGSSKTRVGLLLGVTELVTVIDWGSICMFGKCFLFFFLVYSRYLRTYVHPDQFCRREFWMQEIVGVLRARLNCCDESTGCFLFFFLHGDLTRWLTIEVV